MFYSIKQKRKQVFIFHLVKRVHRSLINHRRFASLSFVAFGAIDSSFISLRNQRLRII